MIDPLHSLAFSIQANPGVYAVLVGSGVSRSAQIPTGWEITIDFVRKLAAVAGENCGTDPALWYRERYEKEPDYSDLLDALAKTPAERQQLLRAYLEPSEEERSDGLKAPTAAHRAIASLAAKGYIRIIITTNFDRLMETALADVGVVPTVLSSPDQVHGAMPLIHTRCCVFKVHGDYLDTRIRNTPAELESYPKEFDDLLDRIFDDFGLILCGWSAEWDTALRAAVERAVSRRFSHFWAVRGEPGNAAKRLIEHRQAQKLPIADADGFFSELGRLVEALEQFSRPHPLSTDAAVASLKGYLAEPIREQSTWDATTIEQRGKQLAAKALEVWPALVVDALAVKQRELDEYKAMAANYSVDGIEMDEVTKNLFESLRPHIQALGSDVVELPNERSVVYRVFDFFVEIIPRKQRLSLLINLDFSECEDPTGKSRDATEFAFIIGANESGGVIYSIDSLNDLSGAMHVMRQAYERATE